MTNNFKVKVIVKNTNHLVRLEIRIKTKGPTHKYIDSAPRLSYMIDDMGLFIILNWIQSIEDNPMNQLAIFDEVNSLLGELQ